MKRVPLPFLLGACAMITACAAERLIAPFYGQGAFLRSASLAIAFAAVAAGVALGSTVAAARSHRLPLVLIGGWTLFSPWLRTPLLRALEGTGLQAATLAALVLWVGLPLVVLSCAIVSARDETASEPAPAQPPGSLAAALLGAAVAAPVTVWLLFPMLGITRTLVAAGVLEIVASWLAPGGGRGARAGAAAGFALVLGGIAAAGFAPAERGIAGLVAAQDGPATSYVVVDREDGRFLFADGGIQTLISDESGDPLWRSSAALQILDLFAAQPESMVVVGLRGGGVAKRFARLGWRVRAVEPDAAALRTAERHLHFSASEVPVTLADPRVWAARERASYPVVILDAFDPSFVPAHLVTREFFALLRPRLSTDGVLALSVPAAGWADPTIGGLAAALRTAFAHVIALPTSEPPDAPGGILLLASDRALEMPDERLPQPSDFLTNLEEHWRIVQMNHAWFNRFSPGAGAAAFTDDRNPVEGWSDRALRASRADLHASFRGSARSW